MSTAAKLGVATSVIHTGQSPDPTTGAVAIPISLSTTFAQATPGAPPGVGSELSYGKGFEYSRTNNPTRAAFELAFAASERAKHGLAFASGMAATVTLLHLLEAGNHIICIDDVYGGTQRYFRLVRPIVVCLPKTMHPIFPSVQQVAKPTYGMDVTFMDMSNPELVARAIRVDPSGGPASTKLIWLEVRTSVCVMATGVPLIHSVHVYSPTSTDTHKSNVRWCACCRAGSPIFTASLLISHL